MNTSKNSQEKEQTIIERITVNFSSLGDKFDIDKNQRNVWKEVKTGDTGDLDHFLNAGWDIVDISSSTSMSFTPGSKLTNVTFSQILLEKHKNH